MGSGGMIVMDDTSCMVDVAKYFMDFCREESCGKCVPCRVGTTQLYMLLDAITERRGDAGGPGPDGAARRMVQQTSLCGLGQGAPNPIFSTLRYFRDEYLAHIVDRVCPAGVCKIEPRRCRHEPSTPCGSTVPTSRAPMAVDPRGRDGERHRHPDDVPSRWAERHRTVPAVRRRDRRFGQARAGMHDAVAEGMEVTTTSEQLVEYRRTITEMLFLERNHICAVCVANNHCELQDLAEDLEVDHFELPVDQSQGRHRRAATRSSRSTTTAASCACAACGSAARSRAPTRGASWARASTNAS